MGEYYPDQDDEYDERVAAYYNDAPPLWRRPAVLGALATIAVFCTVVWFAYNKGLDQGAHRLPPLVQADPGPAKVPPDQPGGLEVPHQDRLIYSQLSGKPEKEGVEQLLPPPEEPVEVPKPEAAQGAPAIETAAGPSAPQSQAEAKPEQESDAHAKAEPKPDEKAKTAQASDEEADGSAQDSETEPKLAEKQPERPSAKAVEARPLPAAPAAAGANAVASAPIAPTPLSPASRPSPYQYQPASDSSARGAPPAPVRSAPGYAAGYAPEFSGTGYSAPPYPAPSGGAKPWVNPDTGAVVQSSAGSPSYASAGSSYGSGAPAYNPGRMAALEPASPGPAAGGAAGAYYIQLGSVRDQAQAQSEWARLSRRAPEVLDGQRPIAKRADLGAKGIFYRLQAGPYPDRAGAIRACEQMRSHGQGCMVVAQ